MIRERRSPGSASAAGVLMQCGSPTKPALLGQRFHQNQSTLNPMPTALFEASARGLMHHGRSKGCLPFERMTFYHTHSYRINCRIHPKTFHPPLCNHLGRDSRPTQTSFLFLTPTRKKQPLFLPSSKHTDERTKSDRKRRHRYFRVQSHQKLAVADLRMKGRQSNLAGTARTKRSRLR